MMRCWPSVIVLAACGGASRPDQPGPPAAYSPGQLPALAGQLQIQPTGHCGGAARPAGYVSPTLAPAPGMRLAVVAGERYATEPPPAAIVTTARDGTFAADLPAGRYCIVLVEHKGPRPMQGDQWNELSCLVEEWERCLIVVDVPVDRPIAIDHHLTCFSPCYHGPPPP